MPGKFMKLTADRKALADAAKAVARFLPTHIDAAMGIAQIHLEAHSGIVALTATDLQAGRRIEVEATVEGEGEVLVGDRLPAVLAGATGEIVELSSTKTNLAVASDASSWRLPLGNVDDYPKVEIESETDKVPVDDWERVRAVARIADALRSPRPESLKGVLFEEGTAVATDSYRLAHITFSSDTEHQLALIPAYAIASLDAEVTAIHLGERTVHADTDDGAWWSRLIEAGGYPKWRNLADPGATALATIKVDSSDLTEVIRRAMLIGDPDIPLWLEFLGHGIKVLRKLGGEIAFSETVTAGLQGETGLDPVAVSAKFLRSMIDPVGRVRIGIVDSFKPLRISGDSWWSGIMMPVRT